MKSILIVLTSTVSKLLVAVEAKRCSTPGFTIAVFETLHIHFAFEDEREMTALTTTSATMGQITVWKIMLRMLDTKVCMQKWLS